MKENSNSKNKYENLLFPHEQICMWLCPGQDQTPVLPVLPAVGERHPGWRCRSSLGPVKAVHLMQGPSCSRSAPNTEKTSRACCILTCLQTIRKGSVTRGGHCPCILGLCFCSGDSRQQPAALWNPSSALQPRLLAPPPRHSTFYLPSVFKQRDFISV